MQCAVNALPLLLVLLSSAPATLTLKILGAMVTPAISHQRPFLVLMRELAERGHNVTIITTDPLTDPPENLTQIDMSFTYKWYAQPDFMNKRPSSNVVETLTPVAEKLCEAHFEHPQINHIIKSGEKYDVVIMETFLTWCYLGVVRAVGSPPLVGLFTAGMISYLHDLMGNPRNAAYMPEFSTRYTHHMTFWQRVDNLLHAYLRCRAFYNVLLPSQDAVMKRYLGSDHPSVQEMLHSFSLQLVANHFSISYPMPLLPNVVELTGLHIKKEDNIPTDLQSFLDGAEHGVILFSMGTNVRSTGFPKDKRLALLEAFAELPQRVLWKWEGDTLPGQPENVYTAKWLPQQAILAHPKTRLFITQAGLQSINEAVYYAVPVVGIPVYADQGYNTVKMVSEGVGVELELSDISKATVLQAVRTVLEDPRYKENMRRFSAVYREHQETSLERAVWWVEYVVRHRGAPHLRSATLDLEWWQLMLLDVIATTLAAVAVALFLMYKCARALVRVVKRWKKIKTS